MTQPRVDPLVFCELPAFLKFKFREFDPKNTLKNSTLLVQFLMFNDIKSSSVLMYWDLNTELVVFKLLKRGRMPNVLVFECHLNTGELDH